MTLQSTISAVDQAVEENSKGKGEKTIGVDDSKHPAWSIGIVDIVNDDGQ